MTITTPAALHTPLCDLLGIRYPICQAGMGWVARSSLAAAVSAAGGLGVIAAAHGTPEHLRNEIRRVRDLTDQPFGVDVLFATIRAAGDEVEQFTDRSKDGSTSPSRSACPCSSPASAIQDPSRPRPTSSA